MSKPGLIFLVFLLWVYVPLHAQEESEEVSEIELINIQAIPFQSGEQRNFSSIQQTGDANNATSLQRSTGSESNIIRIEQAGQANQAVTEQNGTALQSIIIQQQSQNNAFLRSEGRNVQANATQIGEDNLINSYIENQGAGTRSALFQQQGSQNHIEFSLPGATETDQYIRISQTGVQHEVIANMEPFTTPLEITQTPGINGEGMRINISSSASGFPIFR
jgi:hypothetical protein